jgi:hypothetical protein
MNPSAGRAVAERLLQWPEQAPLLERLVAVDTDGDGQPDDVKVDFEIDNVSCP